MYNDEEKRLINQLEDTKKIKFIVKCKYKSLNKYFIHVVYNDGYCNGTDFFNNDLFKNLRTNKKYNKSILGL